MKKHSGAAHLIIVTIILALGLVGAMGYVVWDKVINKQNNSNVVQQDTQNSEDNKSIVDDTTAQPVDIYDGWKTISENTSGKGLSIKYPSGWKASNTKSSSPNGSTYSSIEVKSPDESLSVKLLVGIDGIGGTCPTNDPNFIIYQVDKYDLPDLDGYSFYSGITQYKNDNSYSYKAVVLEDNSETAKIQAGASGCYFGLGVFGLSGDDRTISSLNINSNAIKESGNDNPSSINQVFVTENFKTAIKIVQSLHLKK